VKYEIEYHSWDIRYLSEESLPRFFAYLDYDSWCSAPIRRLSREPKKEGEPRFPIMKREFVDTTYWHYFTLKFGVGKYGFYVEIKYKPFRYIPEVYEEISEISGKPREKTRYTKEYL